MVIIKNRCIKVAYKLAFAQFLKLLESLSHSVKFIKTFEHVEVALVFGDFTFDGERVPRLDEVVELHRLGFLEQDRAVLEPLGFPQEPTTGLHE